MGSCQQMQKNLDEIQHPPANKHSQQMWDRREHPSLINSICKKPAAHA